ncbi:MULTISPECIES: hypothetical protein [unclassified Streptomyces]|uniref:hypothetical protein n=1 Tax=unclassified Streptomyces TaxID=2593676 RepID=UPI001BE5ED87|nr:MULTISPECIES: hypothetical protein [unclassified Streptomyces]MBT2402374.1 hypothetical protein [Streptomyces sp. ISL-21]MBT2607706.1 hypothetical protein [Streptomyces sp. ISL-87]
MSFGDPNNPYGQQQGQPGYGYPQQAPQGVPPQGGYAYPQQQAPQGYPAYPGGPGGFPGAQMPMPGGVSAARVILFILGSLQALGGVGLVIMGAFFASIFADSSSSTASDAGALAGGAFVVLGIVMLAFALWPILTAAKLGKGRGGVRVSGIIFGSLQALFAGISLLANLAASSSDQAPPAVVISLIFTAISLALGIWIIVGLANSAAGAYFRRPQY